MKTISVLVSSRNLYSIFLFILCLANIGETIVVQLSFSYCVTQAQFFEVQLPFFKGCELYISYSHYSRQTQI